MPGAAGGEGNEGLGVFRQGDVALFWCNRTKQGQYRRAETASTHTDSRRRIPALRQIHAPPDQVLGQALASRQQHPKIRRDNTTLPWHASFMVL